MTANVFHTRNPNKDENGPNLVGLLSFYYIPGLVFGIILFYMRQLSAKVMFLFLTSVGLMSLG